VGFHGPPRPILRGPRTHATGIYAPEIALFVADAIPNPERIPGPKVGRPIDIRGPREHTEDGGTRGTSQGASLDDAQPFIEFIAPEHTPPLVAWRTPRQRGCGEYTILQRDNVAETPLPRDIVAHTNFVGMAHTTSGGVAHNPSSGALLDDTQPFPLVHRSMTHNMACGRRLPLVDRSTIHNAAESSSFDDTHHLRWHGAHHFIGCIGPEHTPPSLAWHTPPLVAWRTSLHGVAPLESSA